MFALSFFLFAGLIAAHIPIEKGVLVLDDHNFDDAIAENEFLLVEFYAPWCGHCKKLAPEWDKAAADLASSGDAAKLAKVDATVATGLAERFAIKGFPTIAFFKSGKKIEYNAGRTAGDITAWLKKQSGPAAKTISTSAELLAAQESNDVIVVGYFNSVESTSAKAFLAVAGGDEVNAYFISSSDDVKNTLGLSEETVVILKTFDDKRADLAVGDLNPAQVYSFILGNSVPLVQTFSQDAAKKIFSSPIQKHVLFFTETTAAHHAPTVGALTEVAKTVKGKALVVNVPHTEDRVLDYFGIKKNALPALVVVDMGGEGQMKKYPFGGSFNAEEVGSHVNAVLSGGLKPTLKSEASTPEDTLSDVVVLRGTTFNDIVLNNKKDVLVEFYAPWCGHCKKLAPTWDELGAHFRSNENVVIAKMDATANEIEVPGVNVKGFPTLYFFPGDTKQPTKYEGGRELDDFIGYLEEHATNIKHDEL